MYIAKYYGVQMQIYTQLVRCITGRRSCSCDLLICFSVSLLKRVRILMMLQTAMISHLQLCPWCVNIIHGVSNITIVYTACIAGLLLVAESHVIPLSCDIKGIYQGLFHIV